MKANNLLIVVPASFSEKLAPIEKNALEAYYKPKIKSLAKKEFTPQIIKAITKAYIVMGHSVPDTFEMICEEVINELKSLFSTFTAEEVCIAIDMGSKGKLDDSIHISVTNLLKWIHAYNEKVRKEAIHKQKQHDEKLAKEAEERLVESKVKDFESIITGIYSGFPQSLKTQNKGALAAMYRHLDKKGLILLSEPVKWAIYKGIQKIKDRTKFARKGFLEITTKELSEYRALKHVFKDWKEFDYDLKSELEIKSETDKRV